jgi:ATP-dependent DNA helicase RecG
MAGESQNIEYKQSWRDEYLKWICGFANAQGGTIFIGMNDDGSVCGVEGAKKLMEDIPNKVRDVLGIVVDVNLHEQDGLQYLEIVTGAYPYPVSYKGEYHYRSGSTKQELKGAALDRFILRKQGKTWDGVPVPFVKAEDLDDASFALFRRYAKHSGRMEAADLMDDNVTLLDKLRLVEGDYLKRAAVLTFHPDPERFVTGAYIKIGFFRDDLIYQDEVHGSLFQQVRQTMDLLTTKYLKALISYEGIQRIESLPMPREALREALLNSIVHKAYESLTPIQIAVYDDKLEIFNCGYLPDDWTIDNLLVSHRSRPYNPDIAHVFFRAGEIETWGRGIERIISGCKAAGCPEPTFRYSTGEMWSVFHFSEEYQKGVGNGGGEIEADGQVGEQAGEQVGEQVQRIIDCIKDDELTMDEILRKLKIASRRFVLMKILIPAIEGGYVNRKYPDTPRSPKQKYYLTEKGKQMINNINNK